MFLWRWVFLIYKANQKSVFFMKLKQSHEFHFCVNGITKVQHSEILAGFETFQR